jgi:hypothetical protein
VEDTHTKTASPNFKTRTTQTPCLPSPETYSPLAP